MLEWPKGAWPPVIIKKTLGYHSQGNFLEKKNIFQGWGKGKASEKSRDFIFRLKQGFVKIIKRPFDRKQK